MKAFIIHTPESKRYARSVLDSFKSRKGWEPSLFNGITVDTLPEWEKRYPLQMKELSRAACFTTRKTMLKYNTKKSCSMNHYRLFRKCVQLKEPIAVIEHDALCVRNWSNVDFDDVLILNAISAMTQECFQFQIAKQNEKRVKEGIHNINYEGLYYRHDPEINGANIMPGTASYAITPAGAQKMIDVYETIGWEQSDFIINTHYVQIQTINPELFTFQTESVSSSHGPEDRKKKTKEERKKNG